MCPYPSVRFIRHPLKLAEATIFFHPRRQVQKGGMGARAACSAQRTTRSQSAHSKRGESRDCFRLSMRSVLGTCVPVFRLRRVGTPFGVFGGFLLAGSIDINFNRSKSRRSVQKVPNAPVARFSVRARSSRLNSERISSQTVPVVKLKAQILLVQSH